MNGMVNNQKILKVNRKFVAGVTNKGTPTAGEAKSVKLHGSMRLFTKNSSSSSL